MDDFYRNINEANKIMDEIRKTQEYNLNILNSLNNASVPAPTPSAPNIPGDSSWWQDFLARGKYSTHNPQNDGLLDPDTWANFAFDVIKKTLWLVWNSFMGISHWLCLLVAVAGILAFIAGYKKGGVVSICSVIFYILLRLINMAIGG